MSVQIFTIQCSFRIRPPCSQTLRKFSMTWRVRSREKSRLKFIRSCHRRRVWVSGNQDL